MNNTFGYLKDTYHTGILIATLIFLGVLLLRLWFVKKEIKSRNWLWKAKSPAFVWVLKLLWLAAMVFFLLDVPTWFLSVASFKPLVNPILYNAFVVVLISIAVMEIILSATATQSLNEQFVKRILFLLLSIFCAFSFGLAALIFKGTFNHPSNEESTIIEMPVKGTWLALHAGEKPWVNYHANYPSQKYSIDMVRLNENGDFFENMGEKNEDFLCFSDSVFSPVSGTIVGLVNQFKNQQISDGPDPVNTAGNYLVISMAPKKFVFLSHLSLDGFQVKIGDTVAVGTFLAKLGNSGNSTFPHLHIRMQNTPVYNDSTAIGLPFLFNNITRERFGCSTIKGTPYLNRNDVFYKEHE
jgi:hypothetical protein